MNGLVKCDGCGRIETLQNAAAREWIIVRAEASNLGGWSGGGDACSIGCVPKALATAAERSMLEREERIRTRDAQRGAYEMGKREGLAEAEAEQIKQGKRSIVGDASTLGQSEEAKNFQGG